jgi:uncharacterized protein (DUF2141 family)
MTGVPLFALAVSLLSFATLTASGAELTVTIKNVRNSSGSVMVAIYNSDTTFMKIEHATAEAKAKAEKGDVVFTFHDLSPGKYAVTAFHDENNNGKLDKNWLGIPTEGYGFSNDARGAAGPPKFAQAAFDLDKDNGASISLSLKY